MMDRIRETYETYLRQRLDLDHLTIAAQPVPFEHTYQTRELILILPEQEGKKERNRKSHWLEEMPLPAAKTQQDIFRALQDQHRVVVEAEAWTGKSTLCRWIIRECLNPNSKRRGTRYKPWIPVF